MRCWGTCGEAWLSLLRHVIDAGELEIDDRGPVLEAPPHLFEIDHPSWDDPVLRRFAEPAVAELYARKFTEDHVIAPFKYSYGGRLRSLAGVDQLAWAREVLRSRPHSKSAWVSLTVPGERADAVPCLSALAFRIRHGVLAMSAVFRSQNAYTAYLNYLPLRAVQTDVAVALGLSCGSMRVYIDIPHVYVADLEGVRAVLSAAPATGTPGETRAAIPGPASRLGRDHC
jgi:thymidylate synthase